MDHTMMPSRSTPNLQQQPPQQQQQQHQQPTTPTRDASTSNKQQSVYSYHHHNTSDLSFSPVNTAPPTRNDDTSSPPAPPIRDSATLKSIKYGPGHEKFPSWPVPAAADTPQALRGLPSGGSHRSKSWTDHTNYPKEKVVTYTRPHMKRQHSSYTQQKLKTVMERCEKIPPEIFDPRRDKMNERLYLPRVDHDGKTLGDMDYVVPSPPERDIASKPQLTQADLEEYARSYQDPLNPHLTESGLEEFMEYSRYHDDSLMFNSMSSKHEEGMLLGHLHQKQVSYAQSEGYHSYVSSTDSTSTPFIDRLTRDSEAVVRRSWDEDTNKGRDSVVTTSSGSASSSETLKWHGSMSDVSVASSSCTHLANSSSSRQLIAHSARVQTPQRHHSESVLYMSGVEQRDGWKDRENRNNTANKLKLFAVNTYTVPETQERQQENGVNNGASNRLSLSLQSALSVADRISELERQQKYSYLDPNKKHKVPDPTLKAIQKKALLSFYERHHTNNTNTNKNPWRSEPQLAQSQKVLSVPQPLPKITVNLPSRRASSASDYASGNNSKRSSLASSLESSKTASDKLTPRHQHSNSCGSLSSDLLGPVIVGKSISVDDWVPEIPPARPPKNPNLRTTFPDLFQNQRDPSPDLPPPPSVTEDEVHNNDEPLPPPPPELAQDWQQQFDDRLKDNNTSSGRQIPQPQVLNSPQAHKEYSTSLRQTVGIPERSPRYSLIKTRPGDHIIQQVSSKPYNFVAHQERVTRPDQVVGKSDQILGFPSQRGYAERSSTRYPTTQKLVLNGIVAVSQKVNGIADQLRPEPLTSQKRLEIASQKREESLAQKRVDTNSQKREEIRKQPFPLPARETYNCTAETHRAQRASVADSPVKEIPPPLQPRHARINQSMRARICQEPGQGIRISPPKDGLREARSASMSQSKASYLASRRDRDRIVSDSECGSYKRTMSPNGHAVPTEVITEPQKVNSRETIWPLNRPNKDAIKNNNNILRRPSLHDRHNKPKCDEFNNSKEDSKKPNLALPDVLPVNVKMLGPRSHQFNRPTQLSLSPLDSESLKPKTPPSSPPKSPSRGSPFAPLRTTNLSSTSTSFSLSKPIPSPVTSTPNNSAQLRLCSSTSTASASTSTSPPRASPHIKPPLSPAGSPIKLSPVRISPSNTSSPLQIAASTSPPCSPKVSQSPLVSPLHTPSKTDEYPKVIEGLQMIQRTEVVLRVNTQTTDASSQTEKDELPPTPLPIRKKLQEEIDCEKLSEDFVNHLPTSDRLKDLLVPGPDHKKPSDYVQGLFRVEVTSRPRPANSPFRSRNNTPSSSPPPTLTTSLVPSKNPISKLSLPATTVATIPQLEPTSPLSGSSTYFTTSEPKAKFLTRYSQDMNQCNIVRNTKDLSQKKEELVSRLDRKLEVLRSEALVVSEECKINDELGENVEDHINRVARPQEVAKFRLHVEEVGKVTSLLLGLSGRLARAENALMGMPEDHPERRILETKRDKLLDQLEEAKKLKECIDRRSVSVSNILYKYLTSEEYADYDHFINMKAKLIMDSKEITDKIKLGEEQLGALRETLIVTD